MVCWKIILFEEMVFALPLCYAWKLGGKGNGRQSEKMEGLGREKNGHYPCLGP